MKRRGRLQDLYRAKESFVATLGNESVSIEEGDLVRAGHPLLASYPDHFEAARDHVRFEVEQATAAPGEER